MYRSASIILAIRIDNTMFSEYFTNLNYCLESLNKVSKNNLSLERIIVDWGSLPDYSKKIQELVSRFNFSYWYSGATYWSRSQALNFAVSKVTGSRTLVIDADTVVPASYILDHLGKASTTNYTLSYVYNSLVKGEEKRADAKELKNLPGKMRYSGRSHIGVDTSWLKTNKYNNRYVGWGGEDDDLIVRMQLSGLKEIVVNSAPVHLWHNSYGNVMHALGKESGKWYDENKAKNKSRFVKLRQEYKKTIKK
jgi:hypothetical protein